jgi:aminopeptidase N
MNADSVSSSHPISVEVNNPDEINEIFDGITYGKGGSVIRMMNYFLGDKVFISGLNVKYDLEIIYLKRILNI